MIYHSFKAVVVNPAKLARAGYTWDATNTSQPLPLALSKPRPQPKQKP